MQTGLRVRPAGGHSLHGGRRRRGQGAPAQEKEATQVWNVIVQKLKNLGKKRYGILMLQTEDIAYFCTSSNHGSQNFGRLLQLNQGAHAGLTKSYKDFYLFFHL